jgi:hypothetical protein
MSGFNQDQPVQPAPPPAQYLPPQSYWQPSPPAPRQNNGLAITALVVASLALLIGLSTFVSQIFATLFLGIFSAGGGPFGGSFGGPSLEGTAPQVATGQAYPGQKLQDEVSRVISNDGSDVGSITCPDTLDVKAGAATVCHGLVDGFESDIKVTFEDGVGHFTLVERDTPGG